MEKSDLSLLALLDLADLGPVRWLAGGDLAERCLITWVSTSLETLQLGDLLLIPGEEARPAAVELAQENGSAALLALGKIAHPGKLRSFPLPIAQIQSGASLREVLRRLVTILIDRRAYLMEWADGIHAQLAQLEAGGAGLNGLARAMTEISGQGVIVQDKRLTVMASSASPALAAVWEPLLEQLQSPQQLPERLRDRKLAGQEPLVLTQSLPGGLARIVTPVSVAGVARGYLSLVAPEGELDVLDQLVVEKGALVSGLGMARSKAVREAEKRLHGDLLGALLQGDLQARDARLWAQAMGLDLDQKHAALRFRWGSADPPSRRRLETLVNGQVALRGLQVIVNPMESQVICFCQVPPAPGPPKPALNLAREVLANARAEDPEAVVHCGVGVPVGELKEWRASFRQAGQALEMARRLDANRPLYFPDLSVYRLLLQLEYHPELRGFLEEILGPLLAYEMGPELVRTLRAYFDHNGNLTHTAASLFIHRNTLGYRLDRVAEITGLDLNNPESRLALQLALHIHQMLASP
jgi:purine catabolism regulator